MATTKPSSPFKIDPYLLAIIGMVLLASFIPAQGSAAVLLSRASRGSVALLFFLYGGRLSTQAILEGIRNWRLQLVVLTTTFVCFPLLGLALGWLMRPLLSPELTLGLVFLCLLPSTVQSSIAFTSIGRGNVAAAVCSASLSNLVGVVVSPLLVSAVMRIQGQGFSLNSLAEIALQLLAPFLLGQALRPVIGLWLDRHRRLLGHVDRSSILLIVYTAFSEGVVDGLWQHLALEKLLPLVLVNTLLLASVLGITTFLSRYLRFSKADEIAIVFCGSKKSLASGVPMANILFAGSSVSLMVVPLMLFHQIQLMVCAFLAQRYAARQHPDAIP